VTEAECLSLAREWNADFRRLPNGTLQWTMRVGPAPVAIERTPEEIQADVLESYRSAAELAVDEIAKVYFIGGDEGAIKIGFSVDPPARLRAIQSCCPIPLRILAIASGGVERESYYHFRFADHRLHGEWFTRHPSIQAEIDLLNRAQQSGPRSLQGPRAYHTMLEASHG
jgi:hypothetical protein